MRAPLRLLVGACALLWPAVGGAHLIDEIAQNIVLDARTNDGKTFELTYALHDSHVQAFYSQARQLGMAPERSDAAFAEQLARAFSFDSCVAKGNGKPSYRPQPSFRAWGVTLRCAARQDVLKMQRVDYRRAKTRTTLFIGVRVKGARPRRLMIPPRLAGLDIPIFAAATPTTDTPSEDGDPHQGHADAAVAPELPDPTTARERRGTAWLIPPPIDILVAWAQEGAAHLLFGADHLLFLVALVLCAASLRWLVLAVLLFSLGHIAAMGIALSLKLPGHWLVEVGIGLSITWAGWRAWRHAGRAWSTNLGVLGFGLVHGWAFGSELGRLVMGVDGLLWPLLSFGVGLDLAQLLWCGLWYLALAKLAPMAARDRREKADFPGQLRTWLALAVAFGGGVLAVVAATSGVLG